MNIEIKTGGIDNYELLDSGNKKRLEKIKNFHIIRYEPKAWWRPCLSHEKWQSADAEYTNEGKWIFRNPSLKSSWKMSFNNFLFEARISETSRHLGFFPEQSVHWHSIIDSRLKKIKSGQKPLLLNLFGYTGLASLAALSAGYRVTHIDASRPAIEWAKRNQALSGFENKPVRWILDDVIKFVHREIRRNNRYDAIILDPPSFGRGPSKELWKAENALSELLIDCRKILSDSPMFIILTLYNLEASAVSAKNMIEDATRGLNGNIECGELGLKHTGNDRILPLSIYAKWSQ